MNWFRTAMVFIVIAWQGCSPDSSPDSVSDLITIPYKPSTFELKEAAQFVKMQIPEDNPLTVEGVELGRRLFYDPILSADSTMSCSNCHQQGLAFTDGQALSRGILQLEGRRSAPSLLNIGYHYKGLFWDGRAESLEKQALIPIEDSLELNHSWEAVEHKLQKHIDYPVYFRKAFGIEHPEEIKRSLITKAIAQFERILVSYNSKFDRVLRGEARFNAAEQRGWSIFFDASDTLPHSECGHCHVDPLFTDLDFANNGLEAVNDLNDFRDKGRGSISNNIYDNGKFKTPTLRNIALTSPYMHDGRFKTLEEVIEHYIRGGHPSFNASPNVRKLELKESDIQDLVAFLNTLTDSTVISNPAFANPF